MFITNFSSPELQLKTKVNSILKSLAKLCDILQIASVFPFPCLSSSDLYVHVHWFITTCKWSIGLRFCMRRRSCVWQNPMQASKFLFYFSLKIWNVKSHPEIPLCVGVYIFSWLLHSKYIIICLGLYKICMRIFVHTHLHAYIKQSCHSPELGEGEGRHAR